ncbi:DSD1 family PLP-dependent enzyme [Oxalicibacterium faecigallinarum]|uniref:Alanine racemase n=1 Tax=Oxalicibacterium faecigallinarum TaxID=573741 RepID=A0A8J3AY34_9BURK|nr:DSD1 family PLP-dependent enzyme [Oxalicibacterium faecigallinarum]GGI18453.1 alanine racemase [Oxalicibacterium faecigallinarum]
MNMVADLALPPLATIGAPLSTVSTPALLLDLDAFEANVSAMATMASKAGVALRPHAKAHKSSAISQYQIGAGAVGICCQKLTEAYPFVRAGIDNIHISNEFVGADKVEMAIHLARHVALSICVDHVAQVHAVGQAATAAGVRIGVFPEVDIGQGRCGVESEDALAALVDAIAQYDGLKFRGLQAYHGGIQHVAGWHARRDAAAQSADKAAAYVRFLEARGVRCPVVTGAGTGTAEFDAFSGVFTELQPGSYIFLDGHYGSSEWIGTHKPRHGLFIAATIMSSAKPGKLVCDVGLKGVAVDSGLPRVHGTADLHCSAVNDEHAMLKTSVTQDRLGERLLLIPGHCDPTCNLYDQFVCFRGGIVEDIWAIDARGLSQ